MKKQQILPIGELRDLGDRILWRHWQAADNAEKGLCHVR